MEGKATMTRHRVLYHAIWIGLLLALASPASAAAPVKWDQEKAAAIAFQLYEGVDSLYDTLYKQGSSGRLASGGLDYNRLKDRVRVMRSESRHLANELKKGKGHDETVHAFERLMQLVRDARELANSLFLEEPTIAKIKAARKSLDEIARYYDPDALSKGPKPTIPLEEAPKKE